MGTGILTLNAGSSSIKFALFAHEHPVPRGLTAFVPTEMVHPHADLCVVEETRVIGPGVAVLPPLPRMLFWLGPVAEQALVVNVRGGGLVVITGCGHPEIELTGGDSVRTKKEQLVLSREKAKLERTRRKLVVELAGLS